MIIGCKIYLFLAQWRGFHLDPKIRYNQKKSWAEDQRILSREVAPVIGNVKAGKVKRVEIINILDTIVGRGAGTQANRTLAVVRRMFNYAIEIDIIEQSPCSKIKMPAKEVTRDRVLSEDEIKLFMDNLGQTNISKNIQIALKIQLLTLTRKVRNYYR
jgi:site-specific recombinase XerD